MAKASREQWLWLAIAGAGALALAGVVVWKKSALVAAAGKVKGVILSTYFKLAEFLSHDGAATPPDALANLKALTTGVLDKLRAEWGEELKIVSGYRSPAHNTKISGAKESQHMLGRAADVRPKDLKRMPAFIALCEKHVKSNPLIGGCGIYPGWVHLDIRPRIGGHVARWVGK